MPRIEWLHNSLQDLRYSIRILRKNPATTGLAISTLAIGIAACTVVFSLYYNLTFNAFAAKNADRLVIPILQDLDEQETEHGPLRLQLTDLEAIRNQNHVFENVVGYITAGGMVLADIGTERFQFSTARVTADAFEFYGVPPLLGRGIATTDGEPGATPVFVMSYLTWKNDFNGNPAILGTTFNVDGEARTLVGIMPPRFQAFGSQEQIWIPLTRMSGAPGARIDAADTMARLKTGVTLQEASSDLDVILKRVALQHPSDFPKHFRAQVEPASDSLTAVRSWGATPFHSDVKHLLYDLLAAVMLLLLIACSNVANLQLSKATAREHEIAVRSALGATRGRLLRQLLTEGVVLAAAACLLGCVLAWSALKIVTDIMPRVVASPLGSRIGVETVLGINVPILSFAMLAALLTSLICGLAPAMHLSLRPALAWGKAHLVGSGHHANLRTGLVIAEVSLSIVLLTGTGLMIRSFFLLTHVNLGFNPHNVLLTAFLPPPSHAKTAPLQRFASDEGMALLEQVVQRLQVLPGVTDVAVEDTIPGYGPTRGPQATAAGARQSEEVGLLACDQEFLPTLELRMLSGRWLSGEEVRRKRYVTVITQRLAHDLFGNSDPVGQLLQIKAFKSPTEAPRDAAFQIVGVVADIKNNGPEQPAMSLAFLPYTIRGGFVLLLKTTVPPDSLAHSVQQTVWSVDRDEIVGLSSPLDDFLQKNTYATPEFGLLISAPLAAIALVLVLIGIFCVMAYTVSLRTREIGLRMALGAQRANVLKMVFANGLRSVGIGTVIGFGLCYWGSRYLSNQIWGISTTDSWTFASVAVLIALIGLVACFLPASRAAAVDPIIALRYE